MQVNEQSKKSTLLKLAKYHAPYKYWLLLALCLMLISNTCILFGPFLTGKMIDTIAEMKNGTGFEQIYQLSIIMILLYAVSGVLTYVTSRIMITIGKNIASRLRTDIQNRLLDLPISYFDTKQVGDMVSCFSYDVGVLNTSLTNDLLQIGNSIITLLFTLTMMIKISAPLVLVFSLTISATFVLAKYRLTKTKPLFRKRSRMLGVLNGYTEEMLSGIKTIIAYQQQEKMKSRYEEHNKIASDSYFEADFQGSFMGTISAFIANTSLSLVGLTGTIFYMFGMVTIGNLSAFVLYSRKFTGPVNELANIMGELQSALSAANRIFSLLEETVEPEDQFDAVEVPMVSGDISFQHVDFGYVPNKIILKDMNLEVTSGQTIAIVGPTGVGKTTIINLLMRFYDYSNGQILIDGIPLTSITRNSLRSMFSMVLQETWIFQGTIFDNIAYVHRDATLEDVKRVAKAAKIDTFINTLPDGYQTVITDEGSNLSKGQKQLISIARAMLVKAPMLILDEATSNIDSATEILVQEAMANLMQDKTCFVIAHRLSTIQHADNILVLGKGKIAEQGTHEELLALQGQYHAMYYSQVC